jgi:hypothetical protein
VGLGDQVLTLFCGNPIGGTISPVVFPQFSRCPNGEKNLDRLWWLNYCGKKRTLDRGALGNHSGIPRMKINIAVNGYRRIGRCIVRARYESPYLSDRIRIVAINELADLRSIYHLTKYDSTHGRFTLPVRMAEHGPVIGQD